jgi:hypothetical protein
MGSARLVRNEYKYVCKTMHNLDKKGGGHSPLPSDSDLYCRLEVVKNTLEWVHPLLIRTECKGPGRLNELLGYKHFAMGPTRAVMHP